MFDFVSLGGILTSGQHPTTSSAFTKPLLLLIVPCSAAYRLRKYFRKATYKCCLFKRCRSTVIVKSDVQLPVAWWYFIFKVLTSGQHPTTSSAFTKPLLLLIVPLFRCLPFKKGGPDL
ncbi:hypothetical protein CEXT_476111 [Caerostris extrusa]|uniref:Uncharacterized protein n=1 Tax=Caerostris extrusa TaxID=172846 RepID=A0AAV4N6V1_CAEEX|nr:hypothetical protein CEXT_476111 [Caerostris extrusa]